MSGLLDILSVGMVTAVGLDAPSACAAMRARLDGFRETRFTAGGEDWQVGAPVPLPRPWVGEKRLAHLAAGAIVEAFEAWPDAVGQTLLILCLAEEGRPGRLGGDGRDLLRAISEIVESPPFGRSRVVAHGRPSGAVALAQARKILAAGEAPYVMVAGVDTYLTPGAVDGYGAQGRLLRADVPNGFLPGEAAAAVLCGPAGTGGFHLYGTGLAREPAPIYNAEDRPLRADGLTAAYKAALDETGIDLAAVDYRIGDLIGEQFWFKQSALAAQRLIRGRTEFQDIWSPAESIGNVGAAVVPLMVGMAFTAARKGYAPGDPVLIEASADDGACAALVLSSRIRR